MLKKLEPETIAQIIDLYKNKVSPKIIGEKFGIANNSVTRILKNHGIDRTILLKVSQEETQYIIDEYSRGVSSEIIANAIGRDGMTVRRILKKNNIPIRPTTRNKRKPINNE